MENWLPKEIPPLMKKHVKETPLPCPFLRGLEELLNVHDRFEIYPLTFLDFLGVGELNLLSASVESRQPKTEPFHILKLTDFSCGDPEAR